MNKTNKQTNPSKSGKSKQIVAWTGIILLVALYIVTLIVAIFDTSSSGKLFALCLFATVAVPLLIWIYTWMYGKLTGKRTFADVDEGATNTGMNNEKTTKYSQKN